MFDQRVLHQGFTVRVEIAPHKEFREGEKAQNRVIQNVKPGNSRCHSSQGSKHLSKIDSGIIKWKGLKIPEIKAELEPKFFQKRIVQSGLVVSKPKGESSPQDRAGDFHRIQKNWRRQLLLG